MIHDKVHADIDSLFMAGRRQILQILHRAELRLHLTEIRHCIAAVRTPLWRIEERHQMDIIDIALFDIIQLRLHTFHISCKIVNVKHHAQQVVLLIPVPVRLALRVKCPQRPVPLRIKFMQAFAQLRKHGIVVVQLHIQPAQLVVVSL